MANILFISFSKREPDRLYLDASVRYRCIFPAEAVNASGGAAHCIHHKQIRKVILSKYDKIICHRPRYTQALKRIVATCKKHKISLQCDWDDLLFSPTHADQSPAYLSGQLTLSSSKQEAENYFKALTLFDHATVSTQALRDELIKAHPKCETEVIPNRLPKRWLSTQPLYSNKKLKNKIIRYFPGTAHHKSNFEQISDFLAKYLKKHPDIKLEIVGTLNIDSGKFPESQVQTTPNVLYEDLPNIINQSWVTISPLENTIFNKCKSGLKFWESGLFAVPVISSPNPDMDRFENIGLLQSNDFNEWEDFLDKLHDADFYQQACNQAYEAAKKAVFDNTPKYLEEYILNMTSNIGADWSLALINPAHPKYKEAMKLAKFNTDIPEIEKIKLKRLSNRNTSIYLQVKQKRLRKLRKLKNNPRLFFKDMIKNILSR